MADSTSSSMPVGATGAGGGNVLRITGLNTGLDIDAMVKKMLTADQTKVDQAKQQQQLIQWRQEAYQSIIKDVKDLQSTYFDLTKSTSYLLSSNAYNNMVAASSDATTVSAKAGTNATAGNYKISVSQIAENAGISSLNSIGSQVKLNTVEGWSGKTITFNDGTAILDLSGFTGTTGAELTSYINNQISQNSDLNGKLSTSYVKDQNGSEYIKFTPLSDTEIKIIDDGGISDLNNLVGKGIVSTSADTKLTSLGSGLDGKIVMNLKYNGKEVSVSLDNSSTGKNGSATVNDLITAVKNATGGAVTGSFDDMTGKFTLQTASTGSTSSLQIETDMSNPTEDNPSQGTTTAELLSVLGLDTSMKNGSDAVVTITEPGSSSGTTLTQSSNNFTVNGVTYSITGTIAADSPVNISVTQDTSKAHDLITNFIDKYNNLIGEIQDKLSEKKDYDYSPLTDAQKEEMSDTDITNWENKAKEGILRNDDNLQQLLDNLTSAFTTPVTDSSGKSISSLYFGSLGSSSIGIDISDDYTQGSKLVIDEDKLTDALTNHAQDVIKLFTTSSDSTVASDKFNQSGIFQRIDSIIDDNVGVIGSTYNSGVLTKYANLQDDYSVTGGSGTGTLPDQIYQQQLLINTLTDRMSNDQTKYYNQFTQLEVAMEQLNAQQSTLSLYLG
ncbi:flagellar filament capping protein FliD [Clostridium luticellarii]|uniref:Flagellar hook-associated protein 2 n=1 Tax=Clostridium luticellarii TaxID=1691940 RepID=A0A2T0BMZ1_9CLOT|nr:flagellar filament capping protein FliD [Clostridium luticellarii]PRR85245.1 flagellar capping protein [Clostridium luticellarii]